MARTTTITFDQVAAAANAIKAAGEKPTARRVREALGTGSMATILKFFQQWQGGSSDVADNAKEVTLDPAIIKAISTAIAAQVAAAGVDVAQRIAELEGERTALVQEVERLSTDIEAVEGESTSYRDEATKLAARLTEVEKHRAEIMKNLTIEQHAREKAQTAAEIAKAKLEAAEQIRTTLEQRAAATSAELEKFRIDSQLDKKRIEGITQEMKQALREKEIAESKIIEAVREASQLRGMLNALKDDKTKAAPDTTAPSPSSTTAAKKKTPAKGKAVAKKSTTLPPEPLNG